MRFINKTSKKQSGYSLLEAILVFSAIMIAVAGIYRFYQTVNATEVAHHESQNTIDLTNKIIKSYSSVANFSGIDNSTLISEGMLPPSLATFGSDIKSAFGGDVTIEPKTISGEAGRGFSITYSEVPKRLCIDLISAVTGMQKYSSVTVSGGSGGGSSGQNLINNGQLDRAALTSACSSSVSSAVSFTYQRGEIGTLLADLDVCTLPADPRRVQDVACQSGYLGNIVQESFAHCADYYGLPYWDAWVEVSNTCAIECIPEPSSPKTQNKSCPAGYSGNIVEQSNSVCAGATGYPTWTPWAVISDNCALTCVVPAPETRNDSCPAGYTGSIQMKRLASCPGITGPHVWAGWEEVSNTCQKICVIPSPSVKTQWTPNSGACPTGYSGVRTWEFEERQTASCPTYVGVPQWSAWSVTGAQRNENLSACVSLCKPESNLQQWIDVVGSCQSGYVGAKSWKKEQTRTSTCSPPATTPVNSAWKDTGVTKDMVDNCTPSACVVTATSAPRNWSVGGLDCANYIPAGTYASGTYASAVDNFLPITGVAQYQCINGNLSTAPLAGATCLGNCSAKPALGSRTYAGCSTGQFGSWGQTHDWNKISYPNCWSEAAWTPANAPSGACTNCPAPASEAESQWDNASGTCPVNQYGATGWQEESTRSRTKSYSCPAGTAILPAPSYTTWTNWAKTGQKRNNTGACTNCPAAVNEAEVKWDNASGTCPINQYGATGWQEESTRSRTKSYSCPAGTAVLPPPAYTTWTNWAKTGQTRNNSGGCNNCPGASTEASPNVRWVARTGSACSNPYWIGSNYWEERQNQSRTKYYNCPAGTTSIPSPSYSDHGDWYWSGVKRSETTCQLPACGSTLESQARVYMAASQDLYNAFQGNWQAAHNHWLTNGYREGRVSCWAQPTCGAAPAPSTRGFAGCPANTYGSWTQSLGWNANAYPTCWRQATAWTPATPPSGACNNCPPAVNEPSPHDRWVAVNGSACNNPYWTGANRWDQRQVQSWLKYYNCPAGSATLPAPSYSNNGDWAWATERINQTSCQLPACGGTLQSQAMMYMAANQDLYNAFAGNWQAAYNHWNTNGHLEGRISCWPKPPACSPGVESRSNSICMGGGTIVCEPGEDLRTRSCPGPTYSTWTVSSYARCRTANRVCE